MDTNSCFNRLFPGLCGFGANSNKGGSDEIKYQVGS